MSSCDCCPPEHAESLDESKKEIETKQCRLAAVKEADISAVEQVDSLLYQEQKALTSA
jgi:hypothetical protein